jgi:hypothetical protein
MEVICKVKLSSLTEYMPDGVAGGSIPFTRASVFFYQQ